ncbi:MAG: DNA polymerase III subunit gamma/tau [Lachnospiraceae bacterium]|nr:DNA polymerase III subunit gamma/tau [Lachnospiraceae bacterium]
MSYIALYRKFRPPVWEDVKGQDHIVTTLRNQLEKDRIGHAYLFCGTRGTGKTSVAKIFARAVNCKNPQNGNPCGECASCRAALAGNSMNIVEMDAASNNGVDDARTLIDEVAYSPVGDRFKVYIIDEAHMLTTPAFNALLKTLEDPPEYIIFILATTEMHKIPVTILSRCQRYDFHRISADIIAKRLREVADHESIDVEDKALAYIARVADGALRDGLSLLDQCAAFYANETLTFDRVLDVLGAVDTTVFHDLLNALAAGDVADAITRIDAVVLQGKELSQFLNDFIWYLRNLMLAQTAGDVSSVLDISTDRMQALREQAEAIDRETVLHFIRVLSETQAQMRLDAQKRTILEMALVRLARPSSETGADALEARVRALEQREDRLMKALRMIESGTFRMPASQQTQEGFRADGADTPGMNAEKQAAPAVPDDIRAVIERWDACIGAMSGPLRAAMTRRDDAAPLLSVSDDGRLLIAVADRTAADFLKSDAAVTEMENVLRRQTDKEIHVSVVFTERRDAYEQAHPDLRELIRGVEIEEEDLAE